MPVDKIQNIAENASKKKTIVFIGYIGYYLFPFQAYFYLFILFLFLFFQWVK